MLYISNNICVLIILYNDLNIFLKNKKIFTQNLSFPLKI